MPTTDRYTVISADTHGHASNDVYREYLEPQFRVEFDEAIGVEPRPVGDDDIDPQPLEFDAQRNELQDAQGVVGEVVFPDAQPPFYPTSLFLSGPPRPEDYPRRRAGIHALNRWMVDYCAQVPSRRAGVGTILLNDIDDTLADVSWIAEHGLRGGIQLPNITPDVDWIPHLADPRYDRLWAACQDLDLVINMHLESGLPGLGNDPRDLIVFLTDVSHYGIRPLVLMILSGVFDRFPRLRVTLSELPVNVLSGLIASLEPVCTIMRDPSVPGPIPIDPSWMLRRPPGDYLRSNVWFTASPLLVDDLAMIDATVGFDHLMIGNDYPHTEGAYPFTAEILRQAFHDWEPSAVRKVLAETPAALFDFDLTALEREAARVGPRVDDVATPLTELPERANFALIANSRAGAARR